MFHREKPEDFNPKFEVAGIIMEHDDHILLLQRSEQESHPLTRCVPGGGIDEGETPCEAIVREVREEAGVDVDSPTIVSELYYRAHWGDFTYHLYHKQLEERHAITLDTREHVDHVRIKPEEALAMDLIGGLDRKIKRHFNLE